MFAAGGRDDYGAGGLAERPDHAVGEEGLLQLGGVRDGTVGRTGSVDFYRWTIRWRFTGQVFWMCRTKSLLGGVDFCRERSAVCNLTIAMTL